MRLSCAQLDAWRGLHKAARQGLFSLSSFDLPRYELYRDPAVAESVPPLPACTGPLAFALSPLPSRLRCATARSVCLHRRPNPRAAPAAKRCLRSASSAAAGGGG